MPLYHDMGFVACFLACALTGARLVAIDPFEWVIRPEILLDAIERYSGTFCWLPNFAFAHTVNLAPTDREWDLSSMRAFINCSEPCKPAAFERFLSRFASAGVSPGQFQISYGMAENVFCATQTRLGEIISPLTLDVDLFSRGVAHESSSPSAVRIMPCGRAIQGVEISVVDEEEHPVPDGNVGEIRLRGRFLFEGYYLLPGETNARVRNGWFYTKDMGFLRDGVLFVTGRKDDMLIVNGRNYYAHELEALVANI